MKRFLDYLNRSLLRRMLASHFVLFLASVVLLTGLFLLGQREAMDRELRLRGENMAGFLAAQAQFALLVANEAELVRLAEIATSAEDVLWVEFNGATRTVRRQRANLKRQAPGAGIGTIEISHKVEAPDKGDLLDWDRAGRQTGTLGSVRIGLSTQAQQLLFAQTVRTAIAVAAACLLVILGLQFLQLKLALRPLANLIETAREFGGGNLRHRAAADRPDEIGHLAAAFNEMAERLSATTVSKGYVDNIIGSMGEALIVVDPGGAIRSVNEASLRLLGSSREELTGLPLSEILPGFELLEGSGLEPCFRHRCGDLIPALVSVASLQSEEGSAEGWVLVGQDLTERKRAADELTLAKNQAEAANQAKSAFLANMTHELRSPLNSVIGFAGLLAEELEDRDLTDILPDVQKILNAAKHLLGIVNGILDISKIEAGRMELHPGIFNIRAVLREVAQTAEPLAAKNRNRIVVENFDGSDLVNNDEQKFRQSLLNLVGNACKFTKDGEIAIGMERETSHGREQYRVRVRDTGIGIEPEQVKRLFQVFTQVDASAGRKFGGAGLGLAISRRFCQMMGGDITVDSTPGQGSTFSILVPCDAPRRSAGEPDEVS